MNERERLERAQRLLELLDVHHANRGELERRAARREAFDLDLALRNDLAEVRGRIAEAEAELRGLEAADPAGAVTRKATEARLCHAQAEIEHLQVLLRTRRANVDELARREAGYGPGKAPLELTNRLKAEQEAVEDLEVRLSEAEAALEALEQETPDEVQPKAQGDAGEALPPVRLFIATPDGARYETEAPADTLLVRLQSAFLADWRPPDDAGAVRYTLRREPAEQPTAGVERTRDRSGLRQTLTTRFNEEELRTLCFELAVDYDDLPGRGKAAHARELIVYLERRGRISELIEAGRRLRPDIAWEETPGPDESACLSPALTLEEAGLADGATLYLVAEPLPPDAPVGLTVEDAEGQRYVTKVRLDTPVAALGSAFLEMVQGSGRPLVEVASGAGTYRRLRHEATLYDERVGEGVRLRIRPAA